MTYRLPKSAINFESCLYTRDQRDGTLRMALRCIWVTDQIVARNVCYQTQKKNSLINGAELRGSIKDMKLF
jgi:hypothetical protein